MRTALKYIALAASGVLASVSLAACAQTGTEAGGNENAVLTISSPSSADQHPDLEVWKELVSAKSGGTITFDEFYDGSLCALPDTNTCVGDGRADIGFTSTSYHPTEFPITQIGSLSFQTNDIQAQGSAMQDLYAEYPEMTAEFEDKGQHLLYFSPVGAHQIALTEQVNSLDDLSGKDIRAAGGQSMNIAAIGSNPVAIAPAEVYEAIQRGVLDGASFPTELAAKSKIAEVAPYFHDVGAHTQSMVMMHWSMHKATYDSLSDEQRAAIDEPSAEVLDGIVADHVVPATETSCELAAESGAKFVEIGTPEEGEKWKDEALPRQLEDWKTGAGASLDSPDDFLTRFAELLEEHDSGDDRTPGEICRGIA